MAWGKWNSKRKFGGEKVSFAGFSFDSKLENALYQELKLMEAAGEISDVRHHPGTVYLTAAKIGYRPDFCFTRISSGETEWAEAKGYANDVWPIKKKLWRFYGPGRLSVFTGSHKRLLLDEVIIPKGGDSEDRGQGALHEERELESQKEKRNEGKGKD